MPKPLKGIKRMRDAEQPASEKSKLSWSQFQKKFKFSGDNAQPMRRAVAAIENINANSSKELVKLGFACFRLAIAWAGFCASEMIIKKFYDSSKNREDMAHRLSEQYKINEAALLAFINAPPSTIEECLQISRGYQADDRAVKDRSSLLTEKLEIMISLGLNPNELIERKHLCIESVNGCANEEALSYIKALAADQRKRTLPVCEAALKRLEKKSTLPILFSKNAKKLRTNNFEVFSKLVCDYLYGPSALEAEHAPLKRSSITKR